MSNFLGLELSDVEFYDYSLTLQSWPKEARNDLKHLLKDIYKQAAVYLLTGKWPEDDWPVTSSYVDVNFHNDPTDCVAKAVAYPYDPVKQRTDGNKAVVLLVMSKPFRCEICEAGGLVEWGHNMFCEQCQMDQAIDK